MNLVCLDLEGVLAPEIWVEVAKATGIKELELTTRDEPDYDKLMKFRLKVLKDHNLGIDDVQKVISTIKPMDGAKEFLDKLRKKTQFIILSDTFEQFAAPIMEQLGWPTIFCNSLVIADNGEIVDYKMRCTPSKLSTVKALQSVGFETICSGDSYNDVAMIENSKAGFFFKSSKKIQGEYPHIKPLETYDELYENIVKAL